MRAVFTVGSVFVGVAGIQLFVLADHTDRLFAWTIAVPLTAAFLGAFYWTALVIAIGSWREEAWANARVAIPGVFVFLVLTLAATLLHLSAFHLHDPRLSARVAGWAWLMVYVVAPFLLLAAWIAQLREPGVDPPRTEPLPRWYLIALGTQAVLMIGVGAALFVAPDTARTLWPWPLTPLTAQASAAWLVGDGLVVAAAMVERDRRRIRPAAAGYAALGVLQSVVLARYGSTVRWGSIAAWIYVAALAAAIVLGGYGWVRRPVDA